MSFLPLKILLLIPVGFVSFFIGKEELTLIVVNSIWNWIHLSDLWSKNYLVNFIVFCLGKKL